MRVHLHRIWSLNRDSWLDAKRRGKKNRGSQAFIGGFMNVRVFLPISTNFYSATFTLTRELWMEKVMQNEIENGVVSTGSSLIFLGTGCSSALPNSMCLIQPTDPPCNVCSQALSLPPHLNPNYRYAFLFNFSDHSSFTSVGWIEFECWFRCNTSLLIDYCENERDDKHSYILIDVGKTFRDQVLRWFTFHKIPRVDSVSFHFFSLYVFLLLGFANTDKNLIFVVSGLEINKFNPTSHLINNFEH